MNEKNEKILMAIGDISDSLIEEAECMRKLPKRKLISAVAAACVILAMGGLWFANRKQSLPMLEVSDYFGDMGYEGIAVYDISEYKNTSPWNEDIDIETLPVFENNWEYDDHGDITGDSDFDREAWENEIEDRLEELADKADISILGATTIRVSFEEPVFIGEDIPYSPDFEQIQMIAEKLLTDYGWLLGMDEPVVDITGGNHNIYGEKHYSISFYDGAGTFEQQLLNKSFNSVGFGIWEGELTSIVFNRGDFTEKLGDYPIITLCEAEEMIRSGRYVTSVPFDLLGNEEIGKTELIYRSGDWENCFMPYYRFWIRMPDDFHVLTWPEGSIEYGAYYVPAVSNEYIADTDIWDGSFN